MNIHISNYPILHSKLSALRSLSTTQREFRHTLKTITSYLGYEATSSLIAENKQITVPFENNQINCMGKSLAERTALVPIM